MIGQQLGSFKIDGKLGAGAMGTVYRATHVAKGIEAAVKVIVAETAGRGNLAERFDREAQILKQFAHPHIVRLLAFGRSKGTAYIAMELIRGETLEEKLRRDGVLDWADVLTVGIDTAEALHYAHGHGVVHRDLKPSNLMIDERSGLKLTDFGIAKDLDATALTATGRTLGTAAYMAPEQIRGMPAVSAKTDVYALGCVLYQCLTGRLPFEGGNPAVLMNAHLNQPPPRPSERQPQIPKELDRLIVRMLAKKPEDRPELAGAIPSDVVPTLRRIAERRRGGLPIEMTFGPAFVDPSASPPTARDGSSPAAVGAELVPTLASSRRASPGPTGVAGATSDATGSARKATRKKGKKSGPSPRTLPSPGTLALAAALVGGLALVVVLLQPPSADRLWEQAKPLLDSGEVVQWQDADRRYLAEFERRFPNDARVAEIHGNRDRIALYRARGRAKVLAGPLGRPANDAEALYVLAATRATEATRLGHDDRAAAAWAELAAALDPATSRDWWLLARAEADAAMATVTRNTDAARRLLIEIRSEVAKGHDDLALGLRRRVVEQYERYPYLAPLVEEARAGLPAPGAEAGEPDGTAPSEAPDAGSDT